MAITRRQFIKRTGLATAGTVLGPGLFAHPLVRRAFATTTDKYLVVIFLDGGNDGLNTITPIDDGGGNLWSDYKLARKTGVGGLQLLPGDLLPLGVSGLSGVDPNTGAALGMHPGFKGIAGVPGTGGLYQLYKDGKVAVIQGCGYPDYNLSHEESRKIWQTGQPYSSTGTGWFGRYLAHPSLPYVGQNIPGICIESSIAPEFKQFDTSILAVDRLRDFGFPLDFEYGEDDQEKKDAFEALYGVAAGPGASTFELIGNTGTATFNSTKLLPQAHSFYQANRGVGPSSYSAGYDAINRSVARDLREVAKVIYAREAGGAPINTIEGRYFRLSNGGYDTHSDQKANDPDGQHYSLHAEIGSSLKHFFDDLGNMGVADRVAVVVYSEFARRIQQNDNGTDHGSQGPMFVIGGAVNGGVYGNHPNIAESDWNDDGNTQYRQGVHPFRSTDLRDVYGTILTKWLGMTSGNALGPAGVLQLDSGDPNERWTVANLDLRRPDNTTLFIP